MFLPKTDKIVKLANRGAELSYHLYLCLAGELILNCEHKEDYKFRE